jgi:hypothetical protein
VLLETGPEVLATKPFVDARSVPEACSGCAHLAACGARGVDLGQLLSLTSALSGLLLCVAENRYEGRLAGP